MNNVSDHTKGNLQGFDKGEMDPSRSQRQKPDLVEEAKGFGRDLKDKAAGFSETVTQSAREQVSGVKEAAEKLTSGATEKVSEAIREQKSVGADYLRGVAGAVHRAAGELESEIPQAARFMHLAADQVDDFAGSVKERNVQELLGEVQDFARRQPALFFGGALLFGFAALRFLKSTPPAGSGSNFGGSSQGV